MDQNQKENLASALDASEAKRTGEGLGTMAMSPVTRLCLVALRAYVLLVGALLGYHLLDLAGFVGHRGAR